MTQSFIDESTIGQGEGSREEARTADLMSDSFIDLTTQGGNSSNLADPMTQSLVGAAAVDSSNASAVSHAGVLCI